MVSCEEGTSEIAQAIVESNEITEAKEGTNVIADLKTEKAEQMRRKLDRFKEENGVVALRRLWLKMIDPTGGDVFLESAQRTNALDAKFDCLSTMLGNQPEHLLIDAPPEYWKNSFCGQTRSESLEADFLIPVKEVDEEEELNAFPKENLGEVDIEGFISDFQADMDIEEDELLAAMDFLVEFEAKSNSLAVEEGTSEIAHAIVETNSEVDNVLKGDKRKEVLIDKFGLGLLQMTRFALGAVAGIIVVTTLSKGKA